MRSSDSSATVDGPVRWLLASSPATGSTMRWRQPLELAGQGLSTTLDRLGENVLTPAEARSAVESYAETLREMAASKLDPNISVKLTMLGLDIADDVAYDNMLTLLETARSVDGFVRIDMEGSAYTERTLAIAEALHARCAGLVGTVIQAYLHRSDRDLERLIDLQMRVRLVKGAYAEPASLALQRPSEINEAFVRLMERLLEAGRYPAIATHDPALIRATRGFALRMGIDPESVGVSDALRRAAGCAACSGA